MVRSQRRLETGRLPQTVKRRAHTGREQRAKLAARRCTGIVWPFSSGRAVHFLSTMRPMPFAADPGGLERGWEVASSSWQTVRLKPGPVPDGRSQLRFPTGMVLAREYP